MKNTLLLILLIFAFSSCNKSYKYVETVKEKSLFSNSYNEKEEEPKTISSKNDSLAYLEAYQKFCISKKVYKDMTNQGIEFVNIPIKFSLYNSNGEKVNPYINQSTLDNIKNNVMSLDDNIGKTISDIKKEKQNPIDSITVKKISSLFTFNKDEFDPRELTWIKPKSAPQYTNQNGIYCYFMKDIDGVSNFRLRIQYYSDDWLFIRKYQFSIDNKAYEFIPNNVETDSGNGGYIWEWCDENIHSNNDIELIKALSNAKTAKIKFIGRQYHDIKTISQKQIKGIKDALNLYLAMGGSL